MGIKSYLDYFTAGAGYAGLLFVVLLFLAAQGAVVAADYWLSTWFVFLYTICLENFDYFFKIKWINLRATDEEIFELCLKKNTTCDKIKGDLNQTLENYISKEFRNDSFTIYWSMQLLT